jgi:hypothetical protein
MSPTPNAAIRIVGFSSEECPMAPVSGPPLFTFAQFHTFRNEILSLLSEYGTVGPNGKLHIRESVELDTEVWYGTGSRSPRNPDFYVVSDIWNYWSRWVRIETTKPSLIKPPLLDELIMILLTLPGWCVYVALGEGGLTVFDNRILFEGPLFLGSCSIDDIYQCCASTNKL